MASENFWPDDRRREKYLKKRALVRRAFDNRLERLAPHTQEELAAAAEKLDRVGLVPSAESLGIDPARVAGAFATRLAEFDEALLSLLVSPLGIVADQIELWPEVALAQVALNALIYASDAPDGLDGACEALRQQLDELEALVIERGERGAIDKWSPRRRRKGNLDRALEKVRNGDR